VVKPSAKRDVVGYLKKKYNTGVGKCCELVQMSRSSWYYKSKLDDTPVVKKLDEMVEKYPNRGFENYYYRIRREGKKWAWSRVLRVYREMGLVRRPKKRKRLPEELRKPLGQPAGLNEVWSMDFMSDSLEDGRTFRVLNIIDDYNRECLCNEGGVSYPSQRVLRQLELLKSEYGLPKYIRTDNGSEFRSDEYKAWCLKNGVEPVYTEPGKPMQNGYVERFNRTFREDILDAYLFSSVSQYNRIAERWNEDYNWYHPHDSLGKKSPREFASRQSASLAGASPCQT
jgi:putative transposase